MFATEHRNTGHLTCSVYISSWIRIWTWICWFKKGDLFTSPPTIFPFFSSQLLLSWCPESILFIPPQLHWSGGVCGPCITLGFPFALPCRDILGFFSELKCFRLSVQVGDNDSFLQKTWGWTDTLLAWSSDPLLFPIVILCVVFLPQKWEHLVSRFCVLYFSWPSPCAEDSAEQIGSSSRRKENTVSSFFSH